MHGAAVESNCRTVYTAARGGLVVASTHFSSTRPRRKQSTCSYGVGCALETRVRPRTWEGTPRRGPLQQLVRGAFLGAGGEAHLGNGKGAAFARAAERITRS